MIYRKYLQASLLLVFLSLVLITAGCRPDPVSTGIEEEKIFKTEGILIGQIDNISVEIEIEGISRVFRLKEDVVIAGIADGSRVDITYVEADNLDAGNAGDNRPLLLSIKTAELHGEIFEGSGIYVGQVDSHSVEIEIEGEPKVFALDRGVKVDGLESGSEVFITYRQDGERQLLLSIDPVSAPVSDGNENLVGEGIFIGQIDAQSVEIKINRAFVLDQGVSIEGISDGSLVAFSFRESGPRAVIESIKAVGQPLEGEVMHGTFVGQIDGQSVEIEYFQAFALGSNISVDGISDGAEVLFTYIEGEHRLVLTSITKK